MNINEEYHGAQRCFQVQPQHSQKELQAQLYHLEEVSTQANQLMDGGDAYSPFIEESQPRPIFNFNVYKTLIAEKIGSDITIQQKISEAVQIESRKRVITDCKHLDRKYYAMGKCKSCYNMDKYYVHKKQRRS